jgi:hypothetical protein
MAERRVFLGDVYDSVDSVYLPFEERLRRLGELLGPHHKGTPLFEIFATNPVAGLFVAELGQVFDWMNDPEPRRTWEESLPQEDFRYLLALEPTAALTLWQIADRDTGELAAEPEPGPLFYKGLNTASEKGFSAGLVVNGVTVTHAVTGDWQGSGGRIKKGTAVFAPLQRPVYFAVSEERIEYLQSGAYGWSTLPPIFQHFGDLRRSPWGRTHPRETSRWVSV